MIRSMKYFAGALLACVLMIGCEKTDPNPPPFQVGQFVTMCANGGRGQIIAKVTPNFSMQRGFDSRERYEVRFSSDKCAKLSPFEMVSE